MLLGRLILLIGFILGSLQFPLAQNVTQYISWTQTQHKVNDSEVDIIFSAKIAPKWHLYSTEIPEGGPTPTHLIIDKLSGGELVGNLRSSTKPVSKHDPFFDMTIGYWEHAVELRQRVKVTAPNSFRFIGALRYMICDDSQCMPPTSEEFALDASMLGISSKQTSTEDKPNLTDTSTPVSTPDTLASTLPLSTDSTVTTAQEVNIWTPVVDELKALGDDTQAQANSSIWMIFIYGLLGGFIALLTPCVWPMIPMTVSFFLKRTKNRSKSIRDALLYGLSIIVIYLTLGLVITGLWGAGALNKMATDAGFNLAFFALLVFFAVSFFGAFEIVLPAKWTNKIDQKADQTTGFISILFMAFTLALVSFSCTGPIIGTLLVQAASQGDILGPAIGMLGFATALALPFALFALFPSMLQSMPKSGGWLNSVKVVLAFLELALSLKFLSTADLAYGWHILDREVFLALWIVIFTLLGCYLLGKLRFAHDSESSKTSIPGLFAAIASFAFAIYMLPGLWGAPLRAISAFAPPLKTQDFNLYQGEVHAMFDDYETGMSYARKVGKPVLLDFSGYGCVNCRKMEASVWTDPAVKNILEHDYVLITLMTDDKTNLPRPIEVTEHGKTVKLRTIGDRWSYFQRTKFGAAAQPFYVALDPDGKPLTTSYAYHEDARAYEAWLRSGLERFSSREATSAPSN